MNWIAATDPLALVAIQAGQIGTPSNTAAAAGANQLDAKQRSVEIGEPIPVVFARRRNNAGGILISPGATECRFENDTSNNVTAYYHLVLSDGRISNIEVRDVFQGPCRVGSHSQTYNRRAGTWTPANAIVERNGFTKPEASYYCGSVGNYPGMSTLSFSVTIPNGSDSWNRQVHCFIRGGLWVTRLVDNVTGSSDNFADLVRWMLLNSGRLQSSLVDVPALTAAATFLEKNQFLCNCNIKESTNYSDLVVKWAPYFLLSESNTAGKRGLRPLLPVLADGSINTGAITPVFTFTEDHIFPDTLEIQYTSLADRRFFVAQMIWRQQPDNDFGIIRTAEVRYKGTAELGPYESHDMSEFCCTEDHAVKAGAYILAKRRYTSHAIRFTARPQANNTVVVGGSIIRVRLARNATTGAVGYHDFLYQVERITKTLEGELSYECTHFPIDNQGRSLVALDVAGTSGSGLVLSNNKSGLGCDLNSSTDTTVPAETFTPPNLDFDVIDIGSDLGGLIPPGGATEFPPIGDPGTNPGDGLDTTGGLPVVSPGFRDINGNPTDQPTPDSTLNDYNPCGNGSQPERLVYVNNQLVSSSVLASDPQNGQLAGPVNSRYDQMVGTIVGDMSTQVNGKTMRIVYYCPDASGVLQPTAQTSEIPLSGTSPTAAANGGISGQLIRFRGAAFDEDGNIILGPFWTRVVNTATESGDLFAKALYPVYYPGPFLSDGYTNLGSWTFGVVYANGSSVTPSYIPSVPILAPGQI